MSLSKSKHWLIALLAVISLNLSATAQGYPEPQLPDTTDFGKHFSRTLHLLASSTAEQRNTVKILVYGQSISVQDWWLTVRDSLEKRYPHANLIMQNKAIGGFSSQILYKTVRRDVEAFYPDLVLFHVYGHHQYYDTIIHDIRSYTTAEVGIQTDHYTGPNSWSDNMSYNHLPAYAEKYHAELITIRQQWIDYLDVFDYQPSDLLKDNVHLNTHGEFVMAKIIDRHLHYKGFDPDPDGLVTSYIVGHDVDFVNDTLTLPFAGNRVEIITANEGFTNADSLHVRLDGFKPSEFQGTTYITRPANNKPGSHFPWGMGSVVGLRHQTPLLKERWTCTFTQLNSTTDFSFQFEGSETGFDGEGHVSQDFRSNSGRLIINRLEVDDQIEPDIYGDWMVDRSKQTSGTITETGDQFWFDAYKIAVDCYQPQAIADETLTNSTILFQGVANTNHQLMLVKAGENIPPLKEIRVYRPYYNRENDFSLEVSKSALTLKQKGDTAYFQVNSNTIWQIAADDQWLKIDTIHSSDDALICLIAPENQGDYKRTVHLTIKGVGTDNQIVTVEQAGEKTTTVDASLKSNVQLYPNPASTTLTITTENRESFNGLKIRNLQGQLVFQHYFSAPQQHYQLEVQTFRAGLYFLELETLNQTLHRKFIVNH